MKGTLSALALALCAVTAAPALAQDSQSGQSARSSQPGSVAILRGLDKVTARTRDFEAPVGEEVEFGALAITVQYCRRRPPEEPPEVFAFLQVDDRRTDGFGAEIDGERIFSGWMFASNPALNPLEHPVYDVWVIDCRS
ncbi:MAG: DUF2155 domain-containing protein [Alphaproteobacteria bacterium]|nr:DUF2155 domain-containing protein [Alphaproteobacteria bacterium]